MGKTPKGGSHKAGWTCVGGDLISPGLIDMLRERVRTQEALEITWEEMVSEIDEASGPSQRA